MRIRSSAERRGPSARSTLRVLEPDEYDRVLQDLARDEKRKATLKIGAPATPLVDFRAQGRKIVITQEQILEQIPPDWIRLRAVAVGLGTLPQRIGNQTTALVRKGLVERRLAGRGDVEVRKSRSTKTGTSRIGDGRLITQSLGESIAITWSATVITLRVRGETEQLDVDTARQIVSTLEEAIADHDHEHKSKTRRIPYTSTFEEVQE